MVLNMHYSYSCWFHWCYSLQVQCMLWSTSSWLSWFNRPAGTVSGSEPLSWLARCGWTLHCWRILWCIKYRLIGNQFNGNCYHNGFYQDMVVKLRRSDWINSLILCRLKMTTNEAEWRKHRKMFQFPARRKILFDLWKSLFSNSWIALYRFCLYRITTWWHIRSITQAPCYPL